MPLSDLRLDHSFIEQLPADPDLDNQPRQVFGACYSFVSPQGFANARLLAYSPEMAGTLGLSREDCLSPAFTELFSGSRLLPGMQPYAQCYGGHQFGNWAGQLGDGRAINLGTVIAPDQQHWVLQLKGAGPTPYSRSADGYAVLRSSLREFLCSEAMHHLGVPTTRALSLIATGDEVMRDMFYDGHPALEPGAVVCRAAPSFLRFGSYQLFSARQEYEPLKQLLDYTIRQDFPHLLAAGKAPDRDTYLAWFAEVSERTCELMVHWMRVGFVHGVMNTDNLSILGLTIDYGPYGWLEDYDPHWTPNTTDAGGRRYRFGQQPQVALWNLVQLANAIYPLIEAKETLESILEDYQQRYEQQYLKMMSQKLGLDGCRDNNDEQLITRLTAAMQLTETDMTLLFRALSHIPAANSQGDTDEDLLTPLMDAFYSTELPASVAAVFREWLQDYRQRLQDNHHSEAQRQQLMQSVNPRFVLRNYLAQQAIDQATEGDMSALEELMDVLRHPYDEQPGKEHLAQKRPEWARHRAGCSMLSCSS